MDGEVRRWLPGYDGVRATDPGTGPGVLGSMAGRRRLPDEPDAPRLLDVEAPAWWARRLSAEAAEDVGGDPTPVADLDPLAAGPGTDLRRRGRSVRHRPAG